MAFLRVASAIFIPLVLSVAVLMPVYAADDSSLRVAVLDLNRIYRDSAAAKQIQDQVRTFSDAYRKDTEKEEQQLRSAEEELKRKRTILSPEAFADERSKFEQRVQGYQRKVEERRRSLAQVQAEGLNQVEAALKKVLEEFRTEQTLNLILRKDQIVFAVPNLEITDEVLRRLDKQLPTVKIAAPKK